MDHSDAPRRSQRSREGSHGSNLSGNYRTPRVSSERKSTPDRQVAEIHIRIAIMNRCPAMGLAEIERVK
ncbi:hypothetical protein EG244_08145 [Falsigemmobacter faecalis]|uniref:Uncharacterized protein n=1 Tax=Falsigemmobacter faecalis TaxID=2488730 RepID=A0A3P3DP05_9RHOB|nr:hypothetical protein EG244_08145 [Falsigemmobacter faecalis]